MKGYSKHGHSVSLAQDGDIFTVTATIRERFASQTDIIETQTFTDAGKAIRAYRFYTKAIKTACPYEIADSIIS